jgi:telomerase reverse transcriptase
MLTWARLAMVACRQVLVRKQAGYREVIAWLEEQTRKVSAEKGLDVEELVGVAKERAVYPRGGKL